MRGSSSWREENWDSCGDLNGVTITVKPGVRLHIDSRCVEAFTALFDCMALWGYHVRSNVSGSYNCRRITGGTTYSSHAYGIAVDVNWDCLDGRTMVVTPDGPRELGDLVGNENMLLTRHTSMGGVSRYVPSMVHAFGTAPVKRVVLSRRGASIDVLATDNHRWFLYEAHNQRRSLVRVEERTTSMMSVGDKILGCLPPPTAKRTHVARIGVIAGLCYGDGTKRKNDSTIGIYCEDDIEALLPWCDGLPIVDRITLNGIPGKQVSELPRFFKDPPDLDGGASWLKGWLAGYFAADGSVSQTGCPQLTSRTPGSAELFVEVASRLGIACCPIRRYADDLGRQYKVTIVAQTCPSDLFLKPEHRRRFEARKNTKNRHSWTVAAIENVRGTRDVFCPVVPDTRAFALDGWVLTGNSNPYVRGRLVTDMSEPMIKAIHRIRTKNGLRVWRWGGDWDNRPDTDHRIYDAMHFEIIVTPEELAVGIEREIESGDVHRWPTLRKGSRGNAVRKLQGYLGIKADGAFGPNTATAVCLFQRTRGLTVDGIVGPATWTALREKLPELSTGDTTPCKRKHA